MDWNITTASGRVLEAVRWQEGYLAAMVKADAWANRIEDCTCITEGNGAGEAEVIYRAWPTRVAR